MLYVILKKGEESDNEGKIDLNQDELKQIESYTNKSGKDTATNTSGETPAQSIFFYEFKKIGANRLRNKIKFVSKMMKM